MFESLIVTLREGIEAALVVGLILIYLRKTGHAALSRWVYLGLAGGIAASVACGIAFAELEVSEEAYEGWFMLAGAACVAGMVLWMLKTARTMKRDIEARLEAMTAGGGGAGGALGAGL